MKVVVFSLENHTCLDRANSARWLFGPKMDPKILPNIINKLVIFVSGDHTFYINGKKSDLTRILDFFKFILYRIFWDLFRPETPELI